MRRSDGLYSRVIAWLKILLPLAALTMLSTIFLLSRPKEPLQSMPFVEALQKGATGQQVSAPYFAGTTNSGDVLTMTARAARPDLDGGISADELEARMRLNDGSEIKLDAPAARLQDGQQTAHLSGGVRIESSQGYVMTTEAMVSHFNAVSAESLGPVQGEGPLGTFEAGRMRITSTEEGEEVQMVFSGGVKLVYQPPKDESVAE